MTRFKRSILTTSTCRLFIVVSVGLRSFIGRFFSLLFLSLFFTGFPEFLYTAPYWCWSIYIGLFFCRVGRLLRAKSCFDGPNSTTDYWFAR
ncbi:hypothetical protein BDF19DRAFT_454857 [Syncephalis fuscata]|nr:hypothetical protein BDF19DRAFT_454857 [Syncephalis fuscata]